MTRRRGEQLIKIVRIFLLILLLAIVVVAAGGFLIYNDTVRGVLPVVNGSADVEGLQAQVEILRDNWGIPHIYASNQHDLFFAQGYVQAQDRWWQMEFFRHTGSGEIEALTGKNANLFETDIFIRTVGWRRTAERELEVMGEAERTMLQAFADGVNAYILSRPAEDLALEYRLLSVTGVNITVRPWTPVDSLVWGKVMAWNLTDTRGRENARAEMQATVGDAMMWNFTPPYPYEGDRPTVLYPEDLPIAETERASKLRSDSADPRQQDEGASSEAGVDFPFAGGDPGIGSNNWVATGSMTANGTPLLANDPHLGIQMPSLWYEVGLHCLPTSDQCPLNVVGFALAPSPGVVIGHNAHIAWGVTNAGADVLDQYRIMINPENPLQYQWNGEWRDMVVHEETIRFGDGEAPVTIQVRETHLGPIINDNAVNETTGEILGFNNEDPVVMRWTGSEPGTLFNAVYKLNHATNWEQFREALRDWDIPSQNFVYADVSGNIGYQLPGRMPIRPAGVDGLTPILATNDTDVWQGYIPFDLLPRIYNPAREFIVTANQAIVPPAYYEQLAGTLGDANTQLSYDWAYGQRAQRITELLREFAPNTVESFQRIQGDNKNIDAPLILPYINNLTITHGRTADARDLLLRWDYQMSMDSAPAALFAVFSERLLDNLYNDQAPENSPATNHQLWATVELFNQPENPWWDDANTPDVIERRDDILLRSFSEAVERTSELLGTDMSAWKWGDLHTATFVSNPLGASGIDLIEQLVNRGPVATGGSSDTVNATGWSPASGNFAVGGLPSMRMIVDVGDFDNSVTIHTTGQSGHPASPHYDDMIEPWRTVQYHRMRWSRRNVEEATADRLVLIPAGS
jgi:penicillin amidase